MRTLKNNFGIKSSFFSPLYIFLYLVFVFSIGIIFHLSVVRLGLLLLVVPIVMWVSLDVFWHSLLLYPFIYWKYVYINSSQSLSQHLIIIPIAIISLIFLFYKQERLNFDKWTTVFTSLILLCLLSSTYFAQYRIDTIHFWISLIQYVFLYILLVTTVTSYKRLLIFLTVLMSVHLLLIPLGVLEMLAGAFRIGALGYSSNEYGAFLGVSFYLILSALLYFKNPIVKYLLVFSILIILLLIIGTRSRGTQVAILGSILFYILYKMKSVRKAISVLLITSILTVAFLGLYGQRYFSRFQSLEPENYEASEIERIGIWVAAIQLFKSSPVIGVGPNNFERTYYKYHPFKDYISVSIKRHAHSLYLNTLSELGSLGFLILMVILYLIFKKLLKLRKHENDEINVIGAGLFGFYFFFLIYNFFGTAWTIVGRQVQTSNLIFFLFIVNYLETLFENGNRDITLSGL